MLQTSRSATVAEPVGRGTVFLSLLSAALIGPRLRLQQRAFAQAVPRRGGADARITGLLTFGRLVQNMVENALDLQRIQHIRAYDHRLFARDQDFFADAVSGDGMRAASAEGGTPTRWRLLLTAAAMVGAVNALLIPLGVALLTGPRSR